MNQIFLRGLLEISVIFLASCDKEDEVYSLNNEKGIAPSSIIYFKNLTSASIEADSVSACIITIQIYPEADSGSKQVTVSSNLGKFSNGEQTETAIANSFGVATFNLSSAKPGKAKISTSVKLFTVDTTIDFIPALPQDLLVVADKYVADSTQSIQITTTLIRDPFKGQISNPIKVLYNIVPYSTQTASLVWPSFDYSNEGQSIVTITNPFYLKGLFKLQASTISPSGINIIKEINFKIE